VSGGDDDRFLSRWSRRKVAAREGKPLEARSPAQHPAPAPVVPPAGAVARTATPGGDDESPPALPPIESLRGLASDYRAFMRASVDPTLKRAALRKLFADPHFNVMDRLDVYIDDYSIPDPIPEAMLARLEHAKVLFRPLVEARDAAARDAGEAAGVTPAGDAAASAPVGALGATDCPQPPAPTASAPQQSDGEVGIEERR
jgi:hypothetical protein